MSNVLTLNAQTAEFIADTVSLTIGKLMDSGRLTALETAIADVKPDVKPEPTVKARKTRSDKGVKRGPRNGATVKPTVKADVKPTVKPRKPTVKPPTIVKPSAKITRATATTIDNHEYIRLVACELALMDAYGAHIADVVDGWSTIDWVPTIGDVRDRYSMLANYARAVKGLEFGRTSRNYAIASAIVKG